jgi:hypothetical protein
VGLIVVQSLLLFPYHMDAPAWLRVISALHVLNALLIFWVGLALLRRTSALWRPAAPEPSHPAEGEA